MILGCDLGATKTLLALADIVDGKPSIVHEQRYSSQDYPDFESMLDEFLHEKPAIELACLGLAGLIEGDNARITYLPWHFSAQEISRRFAIEKVLFINDFEAAAHGLNQLDASQIAILQTGKLQVNAPRVILGAGTGLGVAGMVWANGEYQVIAGEGGHIGFSPQTEQQLELMRWLLSQTGRIITEDIVSGPGLARIYAFLGGEMLTPETVGNAALHGKDAKADAALKLWTNCYGAFAGDLALNWLSFGGVYLCGGVTAKLLPNIDPAPFLEAFHSKREHRCLMGDFPVYLVKTEKLGLIGALAFAARQSMQMPNKKRNQKSSKN